MEDHASKTGAAGNDNAEGGDELPPFIRGVFHQWENYNNFATASPSPPSLMAAEFWTEPADLPENPHGPISREYNATNSNTIANQPQREENLSVSPGSSQSSLCYSCEVRSPTVRCLDCNDMALCYECYGPTSNCYLNDHNLQPVNQISPIGCRPKLSNSESEQVLFCDAHNSDAMLYCEPCNTFICKDCNSWLHKDHEAKRVNGPVDMVRFSIHKTMEETRIGNKSIRVAIDRALSMRHAYEKELAEATIKIKKAMRCFIHIIEERENYLLNKVEKMRHVKGNEITEYMNVLRGIMSGLAHTNEYLARSMNTEGCDLYAARDKGKSEIEYFQSLFKNTYLREEKVIFTSPDSGMLEKMRRQCSVQSFSVQYLNSLESCPQASMSSHAVVPTQDQSALIYNISSSSAIRQSIPEFASTARDFDTLTSRYQNFHIDPSIMKGGCGQAIAGIPKPVTLKPTRSAIPGVPMISFAKEGQDKGQISRPWGLCVDKDGNIIVADRRNNRIQIFSSRGQFISMFGTKGSGTGQFDLPAGITTDKDGRIIVVDKDNHRVQIFSPIGLFIDTFGSQGKDCGQFQYPWDVAVNSLGNIVVTDTRNHRIQLFTSTGIFIKKFVFEMANPARNLKGPTTPRGVCFTKSGDVIVSDFENHRLIMVDSTLSKVLVTVGREGPGIGELNRPSGIVTDDDGRIIVADSKNHRVLVFGPELRPVWAVDLKSPGLDDKDRPSDVALTPQGYLVVLFETLPDVTRENSYSHNKEYIKVY